MLILLVNVILKVKVNLSHSDCYTKFLLILLLLVGLLVELEVLDCNL